MGFMDPLGWTDFLAGVLMFFTVSPIPSTIAEAHAIFLILKGAATLVNPRILPLPVFVLGNGADLMSAAILFTGQPPLFAEYKTFLAGVLFLKGLWGSMGMLS